MEHLTSFYFHALDHIQESRLHDLHGIRDHASRLEFEDVSAERAARYLQWSLAMEQVALDASPKLLTMDTPGGPAYLS